MSLFVDFVGLNSIVSQEIKSDNTLGVSIENAFEFDGASYIGLKPNNYWSGSIGGGASNPDEMAFAFWFKADTFDAGSTYTIIDFDQANPTDDDGIKIDLSASFSRITRETTAKLRFTADMTGLSTLISDDSIEANKWYLAAIIFNGSTGAARIRTAELGSSGFGNTSAATLGTPFNGFSGATSAKIGRDSTGNTNLFKGKIGQFIIFNEFGGFDFDSFQNNFTNIDIEFNPNLIVDGGAGLKLQYIPLKTYGIDDNQPDFSSEGNDGSNNNVKNRHRFGSSGFTVNYGPDYFNALNLHRNGPYGHPIFKQIRTSENPLTRYQVANNIFSFVETPSREVVRNFGDNQIDYINSRYGDIRTFDEVPLSSKYYPLQFLFGVGIDNERIDNKEDLSIENIERILLKSSYGNEMGYFVNDGINKYYNLSEVSEEDYEKIKEFYLNGGLDADDSPISTFEFMKYKETIFPREVNTYKAHVRQRTNYENNYWRDVRSDRSEVADNNFGTTLSQSIWPLDAASDWATRSSVVYGAKLVDAGGGIIVPGDNSDEGILQNSYNLVAEDRTTPAIISVVDLELRSAPSYTRLHTLTQADSVVGPSGIVIAETSSMGPVFQGTALWEAGEQAGKNPFYSSYDYFIEELRGKGKDFSVVPEFRISDHVETLLASGSQTKILDFFEITGGLSSANQSSEATFYETYSTSDFLKHFAKIKKDHQDFAEPSTIKLTCKGLKKFLAYDSFYPAIRTKEMAEQFYDSYKDFVITEALEGIVPTADVRIGFQNLLTPLYAPGTLYNSIKSGVACDYPLITGSLPVIEQADNYLIGSTDNAGGAATGSDDFNLRVPFEATIEPEKYLAGIVLTNNEPHPSGNISASCFWDGNGNTLYKKMASNFCAETSEFFLNNSSFTSISSLEQSNPNFGQAIANKTYAMRVKMYRSMDDARSTFSSSYGPFIPPQDSGSARESITMYSRPSAFGPPCAGQLTTNNFLDSRSGYNFPFTPPYYHGQAWADIEFTPTTTKKYTVNEIIAASTVKYYRVEPDSFSEQGFDTIYGPQRLSGASLINEAPEERAINKNAMQLNSSLNIFSRGQVSEINLENDTSNQAVQITTDVTEDAKTRWVIQTKFETPILNFKDVELTVSSSNLDSGQTPRGMWHQYGRVPTNDEGIYMAVEDVPITWRLNALGQNPEDAKLTGSLADLCGFSSAPVKLGQVASGRVIREAVVAVPFIEIGGEKKFFELDADNVSTARQYLRVEDQNKKGLGVPPGSGDLETLAKRTSPSVIDMVRKARRYVFPPSMDFLNYPEVNSVFNVYI